MAKIVPERVSAQIDGEFVVFLIGMRINRWWMVHKWVPTALAMLRMQAELARLPKGETGCLGTYTRGPSITVQYWRSFEHLEAYAHAESHRHKSAWAWFNHAVGKSRGDVGIWHETYLIQPGQHESVYSGMPPFGLGKAASVVPATGHMKSARRRLGR